MAGPSTTSYSAEYLAENHGAALLDTCIAFLVLETVLMVLLFASRYLAKDQQANMSMTMLMTAGYFTCCAKITLGILSVKIGGAGRHTAALSPPTIVHMLKIQTALQIICPLTTSLTKLGILSLLHTILGRTSKNTRIVIKATFVLVLAVLLIQVIIPFANCKPFSKSWNPLGPGKCAIPGLTLWRYLSIPNVVTTFIMICIPLPAMWKLKVNVPTKLGIGVVFTVCLMGVVSAVMRFYSFLQVQDFHDITYESISPLCWTVSESGIYLAAGVLPTLRPLMRKICGDGKFDKLLSRTFGKSYGKSGKSSFGSWGNKRASLLRGGEKKQPPSLPKKQSTESSVSDCGTESGKVSWEKAVLAREK